MLKNLKDVKEGTSPMDEDWAPKEEAKWKVKLRNYEDGANPRMIVEVNCPTVAPYMQVVEPEVGPPLMIIVARADFEITALGVLMKMVTKIQQFQRKLEMGKGPGRLAIPAGPLPPPPGGRVQ